MMGSAWDRAVRAEVAHEQWRASAARRADEIRGEAHRLRQEAERLIRRAQSIETEAGLVAPCHLCGNRGCNH